MALGHFLTVQNKRVKPPCRFQSKKRHGVYLDGLTKTEKPVVTQLNIGGIMNRRDFLIKSGISVGAMHLPFSIGHRMNDSARASIPVLPLSLSLPDPLRFDDGRAVTTHQQWHARRAEILHTATRQMYGVMPDRPRHMHFEVLEHDGRWLDGRVRRRQIRIHFGREKNSASADLLIYLPVRSGPVPVILGLNFWGNYAICNDPDIVIPNRWVEGDKNPFINLSCVKENRATEGCRGIDASRWPLEMIFKHGYGIATMCRTDIDHDNQTNHDVSPVRSMYPELADRDDNFATIGAWAWALRRCADYLESDSQIDAKKIAVYGWSRLGKAAVWAAANDERFAMLLSQESGAGGAKLFRTDKGQTIAQLTTTFPYWYSRQFHRYSGEDAQLPFDQHLIFSAIAPRFVHVASAAGDSQSYPPGEFLTALLATRVYKFLGYSGLPVHTMPPIDHPVFGRISYHIRPGGHNVMPYDWQQYMHSLHLAFGSEQNLNS